MKSALIEIILLFMYKYLGTNLILSVDRKNFCIPTCDVTSFCCTVLCFTSKIVSNYDPPMFSCKSQYDIPKLRNLDRKYNLLNSCLVITCVGWVQFDGKGHPRAFLKTCIMNNKTILSSFARELISFFCSVYDEEKTIKCQ